MKAEGNEESKEVGENTEVASTSNCQPQQRPRRNIMQKSSEYNNGLLWIEEKELKKALYASLQDTKKARLSESEGDGSESYSMAKTESNKKRKKETFRNNGFSEDNSNDGPKRAKVHAQRKFAQGSNPTSPSVTPVKFRNSSTPSSMDLLPARRPKTEDFLTFLCLRGTSLLPSSLDFFNVAYKSESVCESRGQSPINGEVIDRNKPHPKLTGNRGSIKGLIKPQPVKPLKAQPQLKKSAPGEECSTSSDSSVSDTDEEICQMMGNKTVIYDVTKKKPGHGEGNHGGGEVWLGRGGFVPQAGALPGKSRVSDSVQALKEKYREQRLAKQKEAQVKAKKMETVAMSCTKAETVPKGKESEKSGARQKGSQQSKVAPNKKAGSSAHQTEPFKPQTKGKENLKDKKSTTQKTPVSTSMSTKPKPAPATSASSSIAAASSGNKPVTRHAAMLLNAARETKEKQGGDSCKDAKRPKKQSKPQREAVADVVPLEKQIPMLATDHSYVKRLPATPPEKITPKVEPSKRSRQKEQSDFSSEDDVPLAKRQKNRVAKKAKPSKGVPAKSTSGSLANKLGSTGDSKSKQSTQPPRSVRDPVLLEAKTEEEDVPRTPAGRPSRKTKEAATVYLELLGQKLNSPDDDFDMPIAVPSKKKKQQPSTVTVSRDSKKAPLEAASKSKKPDVIRPIMKPKRGRVSVKEILLDTSTGSTSSTTSSSSSSNTTTTISGSPPVGGSGSTARGKLPLKKWSSMSADCCVVNSPLDRVDTVKTREFMKKLSEAQFKMERARGGAGGKGLESKKFRNASPSGSKAKTAVSVQPGSSKTPGQVSKVSSANEAQSKWLPKVKSSVKGPSTTSLVVDDRRPRNSKSESVTAEAPGKGAGTPKRRPFNFRAPDGSMPARTYKSSVLRSSPTVDAKRPISCSNNKAAIQTLFKRARSFSESSSSSSTSSSSEDDVAAASTSKQSSGVCRRGAVNSRLPYCHPLRLSQTDSSLSSSTSSESCSESEDEDPSRPEHTTISVRQNVTSASVAIQVNLMNDISDLDDDIWEPGFMDGDLEGLFSMDRVVTPTLCKGVSPNRSRTSWDLETPSPLKAVSRSREVTPTQKTGVTPEKVGDGLSPSSSSANDKAKQQQTPRTTQATKSVTSATRSSSPSSCAKQGGGEGLVNAKPSKTDDTSASEDESCEFPIPLGDSAGVKDAPTYFPTVEEFQDPLEYIEKIRPEAEKFGVCKIVPPTAFKPECKVSDEMRFTAHNQYLHKMFHRWGPNSQQFAIVKKHLEAQGVEYDHPPLVGGMELDLPRLFNTVQEFGGLKEVIEKKKWQKVADSMKIAKSAQDRVTKLYDAYCKYLLSYDTLSKEEKAKLEQQVLAERQKKKNGSFIEGDECITKGRSMSLCSFYRIARNTMAMWFKKAPKSLEVERKYWQLATQRESHICVHAGNIDSSTYGYGFSCNKNSPFARHQWNLKVLTNNPASVLRCMGPVMGITIPTLHVGMLFTTGCWYRDPHCLSWIEYLHTGASKIWYGVPASQSCKFRDAMTNVVPDFCARSPIWLSSDTAMVPPNLLVEKGATLFRLVQNSGQFVVVFPRAFTSTLCCGYTVSESVYFAGADWLEIAPIAFKEISDSREPAVFSLQRLLTSIANDNRVSVEVLQQILPLLKDIRENEKNLRKQLCDLGLKQLEHISLSGEAKDGKKKGSKNADQDHECEVCRANCYISMVVSTQDDLVYCLHHAVEYLQKRKKEARSCKLVFRYNQAELDELVQKTHEQIQAQSAKRKLAKKGPVTKGRASV